MAGPPVQIPGLGQATPNEILPAESFAPDLLAAAESLRGVNGLEFGVPHKSHVDMEHNVPEQMTSQHTPEPTETTNSAVHVSPKATDDAMEVDKPHAPAAEQYGQLEQDTDAQPGEGQEDTSGGQVGGQLKGGDTTMTDGGAVPEAPHVAHALEAALDGLLASTTEASEQPGTETQNDATAYAEVVEGEHPEWEADSSPYESSSESDSSDSSSDDDSEDEESYRPLGIEETARLLMAEVGDGDGDAKGGKGAGGGQVRTKNEQPDEPLPKPDVVITEKMAILPLGLIQFIVESTVVIKAETPGEVQALDTGSVLCRGDRTVIGVLQDTIGNVRSPLYTVGFVSEEEIKELGLEVGTEIFYSVDHAKYVFTQDLKQLKGTDASNLHDEEVGEAEIEFSDDEKEAEYKRQLKAKKRGNKVGRGGRDQGDRFHPFGESPMPDAAEGSGSGLNYDEDEDGPYKPLARPVNFGQGLPPSLPQLPPKPQVGFSQQRGGQGYRESSRGGRGDFRGDFRGGRGRGGRGRERGGGDRRQFSGGHGGGDRGGHGGQRSYGGASSPRQNSYTNPRPPQQSQQPTQPAQPPQNPHLPPPPYGANVHPVPPPQPGQWPAGGSTPYVPPPPPIVPHMYGQGQTQQQQQSPAALPPNFNYQAWAQNLAQAQANAYPYGQPQARAAPPPQQHQQQTPQAAYLAPAPAPAWPANPPSGAYVNPAFFARLQPGQAPVPPPPQQQQQQQQYQQPGYWGQPQGGYGQGPK